MINSYKKELNQQCKNFDQGVNCTETSDMINLKLEMKKLIENFEKQKVETFDVKNIYLICKYFIFF